VYLREFIGSDLDTPLSIACSFWNEKIVELLLENGAEVDVKGILFCECMYNEGFRS